MVGFQQLNVVTAWCVTYPAVTLLKVNVSHLHLLNLLMISVYIVSMKDYDFMAQYEHSTEVLWKLAHISMVSSPNVSQVFISPLWISSTSCPHHFLLAVLLIYHFKHLNLLELLLLHSTHWKFLKLLVVSACTVNDSESWPSYALPQLLNLFYPNFPLC